MPVDESQLRHPMERPIFVVSVILNLLILALAVLVVIYGSDWLKVHPILAKHITKIRIGALTAILAPIAVIHLRNTRRAFIRGNSICISNNQFPEIHAVLERHCAMLGMKVMPELYLADKGVSGPAQAFSSWSNDYIVLSTAILDPKFEEVRDVCEFVLGRELGHIRLGHTTWLNELMLSYLIRIPILQNPISRVRVYSCDRYGAYLAPNCLSALIIYASGRRMLKEVNPDDYLRQVQEYGGIWMRLAATAKKTPHLTSRVKALEEAGLLKAGVAAQRAMAG